MNRRNITITILISIFLLILLFFLFITNTLKKPDYFSYNQFTNKIIKTNLKEESLILPEELEEAEGTNFIANNYIVRGYFDSFNKNENIITLKAEIMNRKQYRLIDTIITNDTIMACWPETLYDNASQKGILTYQLTFPLDNKDDFLKIRQERILDKYDFSKLENSDYLIIQLINSVDINIDNKIKKLIIVGSC